MTEENKEMVVLDEVTIKSKIYNIRNQKVMLDFDLAEIYGYSTKRFNEQVKNNIEKFDDDFMFQLSRDEWEILRSKNSTSKSEVGFRWKKILPICIYRAGYLYAYECINGLACPRYKKLLKIYIMKCLEKCLTMIF